MFGAIWDALLYEPLLNALAFLISVVPGGDVGLAVIILTVLVKLILLPLSHKSIDNQAKMAALAPELNKIKSGGASKEEQARMQFELYKKHKTNPFSGCLLIIIQIPIIFALYYVFYKGIKFDGVLYSFVQAPQNMDMIFLGFLDIASRSLPLALLAGASQYLQAHFMPKPKLPETSSKILSFQESFSKTMHLQMKYMFPVMVTFIAYSISGAVALYWITSNIFAVGQQIHIQRRSAKINTYNNESKRN